MVERIPRMVDMAKTKAEKMEDCMPCPSNAPDYPYGLCITLCEDELEKLGLEDEQFEPGDMIHLHSMAMVTSVSRRADKDQDPSCRIELTLTHISCEDESDEDQEEEKRDFTKKLYK